jgi:hypothetical protein
MVNIGKYSRGGQTRGDTQALDHDMGCEEKYIPCGIVDVEMREVERRLERNPDLPKWDILIRSLNG